VGVLMDAALREVPQAVDQIMRETDSTRSGFITEDAWSTAWLEVSALKGGRGLAEGPLS
jgi:hypothetical protein